MTRAERMKRAAPTMAAVYERTFGVRLADRVGELLERYPDVVAPNWLSWEGHRITNAATTARLRDILTALQS